MITVVREGAIAPGPDYRERLYEFIGLPVGSDAWERWHGLANCIYERPAWHATLLRDGRVLVEVERSYSSYFYLLADRESFHEWERRRLADVRDPETGRTR